MKSYVAKDINKGFSNAMKLRTKENNKDKFFRLPNKDYFSNLKRDGYKDGDGTGRICTYSSSPPYII